jgi:hypothetical protein
LSKPTQVALVDEYNYVQIVQISKKYQCPSYCQIKHNHYVYYTHLTDSLQMSIDKPNYKKLKKAYVLSKSLASPE